MRIFKNHQGFILAFSGTLLIFLLPLIFMRSSFLNGDNFVQFYPWFKNYSEALKNFNFPYWVKEIQSGFPLMAEGQIGGFYPFNILMFFLLPFRWAYNYSIILHFFLAGVFTYCYSRKIGSDEAGGYLAALLFCFGSAYGGCFYNIITLRTLAWFPCVLLLFELYFDRQKVRYILFAGVIAGMQLLAGFIQMAAYSILFYVVYFIYKAIQEKINFKKIFFLLGFFLSIACILALPQILLTVKLAQFSNRQAATLGFALWGSFPPVGVAGLLLPFTFLFLRSNFYVGIFSLFFVIFSLFFVKREKPLRALIVLLLCSLFLALGSYNPIYVLLLKLTNFYSFRNPSKFLFFGEFSLAVLAGYGFTAFFKERNDAITKKAFRLLRKIILASALLFLLVKVVLQFFKNDIMRFGEWYTRKYVYKAFEHRYSLDYYLEKAQAIYANLSQAFSLSNMFVIFSWLLLVACVTILPVLVKKRLKKTIIALIFVDIFIFSFYGIGFKTNMVSFNALTPQNPRILAKLKEDKEIFRMLPFDIQSNKLPNWSIPNANMFYGVDSIAVYTPLAGKAYKDTLSGLEVVDDSLGLNPAQEEAIIENRDALKVLNVKYVVSPKKLNIAFLDLVLEERRIFLYRMTEYLPRVFFTASLTDIPQDYADTHVQINKYENGFIGLEANSDKPGFIVFSESFYPGWAVYVDGNRSKLLKAYDLVQAVAVEKGKHTVVFEYKPFVLTKEISQKDIR